MANLSEDNTDQVPAVKQEPTGNLVSDGEPEKVEIAKEEVQATPKVQAESEEPAQDEKVEFRILDEILQQELRQKINNRPTPTLNGRKFRNSKILDALAGSKSFSPLFDLLEKNGTFEFNVELVNWKDVDGEERKLTINRASKTHMWPMGTNFWVRDNALIASRLLNLDYDSFPFPAQWMDQGKQLLLSTLTIMSSVTQLERFEAIIEGEASASDASNWPHIFLSIEDNLNAAKTEPWMHKQDAWQIICFVTLEALEKHFISIEDLSSKNIKLLELICPFLKAVDFTNCPNGGSWEEIDAIRTSVIAWETALLQKITKSEAFFHEDAPELLEKGIKKLGNSIPFECPDYEKIDPHYREADAALIYLLLLDTHKLFPPEQREAIIDQLLEQIESLVGSHGIKRYQGDSYQGLSYYTNEVSAKLTELYDSPSGDSSGVEQFVQRGEIVPAGHEAQWTHFIWQLSTAFGRLSKQFPQKNFRRKQVDYFLFGLSLITGEEEYSIQEVISEDEKVKSKMEIQEVPSFQIPECYNTERLGKELFHYPSMHTPLYWSIAECLSSFHH